MEARSSTRSDRPQRDRLQFELPLSAPSTTETGHYFSVPNAFSLTPLAPGIVDLPDDSSFDTTHYV